MSYHQNLNDGSFAGMRNIPWRGEISIQKVLQIIRDDTSKSFWMAFVRATGKEAGSIKIVSSSLYGAPLDGHRQRKPAGRIKSSSLHTEKGTLPITDNSNGHYLSPLISHIIGFNLYKVKH